MRKNPSNDSSVRSPTSTSSDVRSPTRTSTKAHTSGNFTATVTGGAGAGSTTVNIKPAARGKNPAQRAGWKKIHGVVQPGGIYQFGTTNLFVYPPNPDRVAAQSKWLLMNGKKIVGAFPTLTMAKSFSRGYANEYLTNPRPSRATHRAPSARLVSRRKKNTKQGYFPNPLPDKIALHFNAGNDTNGNPRRLFVVVNTQGVVIAAYDEGYIGESAVTKHFPGIAIVGRFDITPAQRKSLLKEYGLGLRSNR